MPDIHNQYNYVTVESFGLHAGVVPGVHKRCSLSTGEELKRVIK